MVTDEELNVFLEVMDKAGITVHLYNELTDAIAHSLAVAKEGDLILLAGCQGMDYGAEIALRQLHQKMLEYPKEKLFLPLKNRVAGISEELLSDITS
jgi:UDP-N-acetylmuramoyl-L-alanyl-D-glutamate--2,6-diaminopimelate ligase